MDMDISKTRASEPSQHRAEGGKVHGYIPTTEVADSINFWTEENPTGVQRSDSDWPRKEVWA